MRSSAELPSALLREGGKHLCDLEIYLPSWGGTRLWHLRGFTVTGMPEFRV